MMLSRTRSLAVLFASVIILLIGHGLQLTLLPLRAESLGWSINDIGMTGSFYFLGFLLGCIFIPRFVAAVGHIRTFSTLTTIN
ncbi:MAG: MFS transporter, partial [Pseudomonadales bacterium]|nr:MFS transporter [Pseudomonadales bacterium]